MRVLIGSCLALCICGCVRLGFDPGQGQDATEGRIDGPVKDAPSDGGVDLVADSELDSPPLADGSIADGSPGGGATWIAGSKTVDPAGSYGAKGTPAADNAPPGRYAAAMGTDALGHLWLFGGNAFTSTSTNALKNDLWRFDGKLWTWIAGSSGDDQAGVYGARGVSAPNNTPGARQYPALWVDSKSVIWVFGGWGRDEVGAKACWLNDLWRFDGKTWTWMAGGKLCDQPAVHGTRGLPAVANTPGARDGASAVEDGNDRLWLFGGKGHGASSSVGVLNDLWRFEGGKWVWISGSTGVNPAASFGTRGLPASTNHPGGRGWGCAWHTKGSLWIFGGAGFDSTDTYRTLGDLWRFDGTSWTWVAGSSVGNAVGVFGQQGVAAAGNRPGARWKMGCWTDGNDLILFGGYGFATGSAPEGINDLWRFNGTAWTWVDGSDKVSAPGTYGTKGVASSTTYPGARAALAATRGKSGGWVFGGNGYDASAVGMLNDLWLLNP